MNLRLAAEANPAEPHAGAPTGRDVRAPTGRDVRAPTGRDVRAPTGREASVLVVLPTYNEAENIAEVLELVRQHLPGASVLVVDDASPDQTAQIAQQVGDRLGRIEVMNRPGKSGLGSAYRAGFGVAIACGAAVVVEMDSDLSHDPAALASLLAAVDAGADLAIGSRYVPGGRIPRWAWHRRWLSRWGNRYAGWVLDMPVRDATAGFRAYRVECLRGVDLETVRADGYGFQIEMAYRVHLAGGTIVEVPITFVDRVRGTSKMNGAIVVEAMRLVSWWALRDRVLRRRPRHATATRESGSAGI